jgi:hypothetical protein
MPPDLMALPAYDAWRAPRSCALASAPVVGARTLGDAATDGSRRSRVAAADRGGDHRERGRDVEEPDRREREQAPDDEQDRGGDPRDAPPAPGGNGQGQSGDGGRDEQQPDRPPGLVEDDGGGEHAGREREQRRDRV